ncbi:MAG TPA: hypothetical protein VGP72_24040 [Planctomycetota bacterium]|jgi:Cu/Ag efflux protein CusF
MKFSVMMVLAAALAVCAVQRTSFAEEKHGDKFKSEAKGDAQSKTGVVKKVDAEAKEIVVMVARELTFKVNDATKITKADTAAKLSDIKVDDKVTVSYSRAGDTRTALTIAILPKAEKRSDAAERSAGDSTEKKKKSGDEEKLGR